MRGSNRSAMYDTQILPSVRQASSQSLDDSGAPPAYNPGFLESQYDPFEEKK